MLKCLLDIMLSIFIPEGERYELKSSRKTT